MRNINYRKLAIFTELTQSSRIRGSLQGRGEATEFVPNIYIEHRASAVEQFFKQNGYIGMLLS